MIKSDKGLQIYNHPSLGGVCLLRETSEWSCPPSLSTRLCIDLSALRNIMIKMTQTSSGPISPLLDSLDSSQVSVLAALDTVKIDRGTASRIPRWAVSISPDIKRARDCTHKGQGR